MMTAYYAGFLVVMALSGQEIQPLSESDRETCPEVSGGLHAKLLAGQTPFHGDSEPPEARLARMQIISGAVQVAAAETKWPGPKDELISALFTLAIYETHLAAHVHAGQCKPHECDHGRAASLWQIQHGPHIPKQVWKEMQGDDYESTLLAAQWAAKFLTRGRNKCKNLRGAFSLYGTGQHCHLKSSIARAAFSRRLLSQMRR